MPCWDWALRPAKPRWAGVGKSGGGAQGALRTWQGPQSGAACPLPALFTSLRIWVGPELRMWLAGRLQPHGRAGQQVAEWLLPSRMGPPCCLAACPAMCMCANIMWSSSAAPPAKRRRPRAFAHPGVHQHHDMHACTAQPASHGRVRGHGTPCRPHARPPLITRSPPPLQCPHAHTQAALAHAHTPAHAHAHAALAHTHTRTRPCALLLQVKEAFVKLCKVHHPDRVRRGLRV